MTDSWIDTNPTEDINIAIKTHDLEYFAKEIGMPQVQHIMYALLDINPLTPDEWEQVAEKSTTYDNDLYNYNVALAFSYITSARNETATPDDLENLRDSIDFLTETTSYARAGIMDDAYKGNAINTDYLSFCTRLTRMLVKEMREYNPEAKLEIYNSIL